MKKIAIVLFVVAAALAGCGKKKSAAQPTPPAGDTAPAAEGSAAPAEGSAASEGKPAEGGGGM